MSLGSLSGMPIFVTKSTYSAELQENLFLMLTVVVTRIIHGMRTTCGNVCKEVSPQSALGSSGWRLSHLWNGLSDGLVEDVAKFATLMLF